MLNKLKQKLGTSVQTNVPLKDFTTMKVGGEAEYFVQVSDINSLIEAVRVSRELKIDCFLLGGGSNVIISDKGIKGLVIKNEAAEISLEGQEVVADSGIALSLLIRKLAELDLGGLEFLAGIPGTLGGATVNNAGAFGDEIANHIKTVVLLDPSLEIKTVPKDELAFSYRNSVLRSGKGRNQIVLRVRIILRKGRREEIMRKINNFLRLRESQPKGYSSGSFFKNPQVESPKAEWGEVIKNGKVSAGYLLEQAGAKGLREEGMEVSDEHANWIINKKGRGTAEDIKKLAKAMKEMVKKKHGIELEEEVEYVGFD